MLGSKCSSIYRDGMIMDVSREEHWQVGQSVRGVF